MIIKIKHTTLLNNVRRIITLLSKWLKAINCFVNFSQLNLVLLSTGREWKISGIFALTMSLT